MTDRDLADWVVTTCLLYGSSVATAYRVAGLFVGGVNQAPEGESAMKGVGRLREVKDLHDGRLGIFDDGLCVGVVHSQEELKAWVTARQPVKSAIQGVARAIEKLRR